VRSQTPEWTSSQ